MRVRSGDRGTGDGRDAPSAITTQVDNGELDTDGRG